MLICMKNNEQQKHEPTQCPVKGLSDNLCDDEERFKCHWLAGLVYMVDGEWMSEWNNIYPPTGCVKRIIENENYKLC